MKSGFIYSDTNKRYHAYDYWLNQKYGAKVAKIALNAGFSCPHAIEGGRGCIYCEEKYRNPQNDLLAPQKIMEQFEANRQNLAKKWKMCKYIAYFQAGSNTYAPIEKLREIYGSVARADGLVGIDVATRPDCIDQKIAELLAELNQKTDVAIELGLQSCHDETAKTINRGYTLDAFEKAYRTLADFKIPVILHIINSLPGETSDGGEMMAKTAKYISGLSPLPLGVKIHMLYVAKNTELFELWQKDPGEIKLLSKEEYIETVIRQLEILPPQIVVMRLTGDPEIDCGSASIPPWVQKKFAVINDIDKQMEKRGAYQGRLSGLEYLKKDAGGKPSENEYRNRASLTNILGFAKRMLDISIKENGEYADFTVGKGNDALYMKKACPSGTIYAFDIQKQALEATKKRLEAENCLDEKVHLIHDSHANFKKYIHGKLDGAIFNLGYLPGGDKSITTMASSTLRCLGDALEILKPGGVIAVCVYPGHGEGEREGEAILELAKNLGQKEYDCLFHRLVNIPEAPFVVAFQKKADWL